MDYKLTIWILLSLSTLSCNIETEFDSTTWKQNGGENIMLDTRFNMVNDLINKGILLDKTEYEIEEIIGSPTRLQKMYSDIDKKYYMVQEVYSSDIDPDALILLEIHFNEYNKSYFVRLLRTR